MIPSIVTYNAATKRICHVYNLKGRVTNWRKQVITNYLTLHANTDTRFWVSEDRWGISIKIDEKHSGKIPSDLECPVFYI